MGGDKVVGGGGGGDGGGGVCGGSSSTAGAKAAAAAVIPLGKRTKLRRMRQKYGDQNETERALSVAVLGSSEVAGFALAASDPNESVTAASAAAAVAPAASASADSLAAGGGGSGGAVASPEDAVVAAERAALAVRIRERRAAKAAAREAAPPQRTTAAGRAALRALEAATARSITRLTVIPARGDTLAHAVAVVAPYPTLAAWPCKVKLLPGPLNRGKAY